MKYVIIGGDAAGMSAAMQIVRHGTNPEIVSFEQGEIYSYGQCGLPYVLGGHVDHTDDLIARTPETFRDKYGIQTHTLHEVTKVNPEEKYVYGINHRTNETFQESYDRLLIATGASPKLPPWKGSHLDGIFTLKTIPDLHAIQSALTEDVNHVTIIGGGYIGLEVAENLIEIGKEVHMIERGERLAKLFDQDFSPSIHDTATHHGITLSFQESVEGFQGHTHVEAVVTDKGTHPTDLVLAATGVSPNTSFLKGTGINLSYQDAIEVNHYMETNLQDIYAAGDCATQYHRIKERQDYIPLGTHANKQGRIAGLNMVNVPTTFKGVVGTSIIKFFENTLGKTGLSEAEAERLHIPYQSVTIQATHEAGYYSKENEMTIKLLYQANTRTLLGGQIIGKSGVDKRIDVLATSLFQRLTVEDLLDLDLAYAPPYNGVWDPLQQAARRAK
ncbi:NADH dehydrogenase [Pontibacillus halophilus JSM 076056 = DSM 19796]|uniref:NADH dehydrogenase n=1 Tax=Pontibacillus halophilus JSM 076056 = DSM 19796 TaxID=1385510 RepID=A0A0A5GIA9_9BACI|nr:FAD-dependent oxidoreductase [Pontibacillus halophilus]KGX90948.1 NADH dehydrogenase [Pontibacillus halophilus JSM 076056 = DSM 19796]